MYPNLRAELARKGMTLTELSQKVDMSLAQISGRVNGNRELTFDDAVKIKQALDVNVPLEILFERAE
jgi:plasmid maintenance system antidote protein VapI